jgi:hypothetical protein
MSIYSNTLVDKVCERYHRITLRTGNQIQQRPVNAIEGGKIIGLQERTRKVLLCWALSESPLSTRATGSIFSRQIFCNNP